MSGELSIATRFHGPPGSANGGYTAGRLAAHVDAPVVKVTLRRPLPLERPMRVVDREGGGVAALHGEDVVAEARPSELGLESPAPVSLAEAEAASERFPFTGDEHAFPTCFVCGPQREHGDGLRIFCGPVEDGTAHAAPWTPDPSLAGEDGVVRPEFVWASLDCPTATPVANPGSEPPIVLARITARLEGDVRAEQPHVLMSWPLGQEGRKRHAGSAIVSAAGERLGIAQALWIELR